MYQRIKFPSTRYTICSPSSPPSPFSPSLPSAFSTFPTPCHAEPTYPPPLQTLPFRTLPTSKSPYPSCLPILFPIISSFSAFPTLASALIFLLILTPRPQPLTALATSSSIYSTTLHGTSLIHSPSLSLGPSPSRLGLRRFRVNIVIYGSLQNS
ncbi:hypothetical protein K435DRAFT_861215 [Dendrothele bispora CBS 962.96]|uniref:Uncharacterized protein n=1 Tax=Dendrothele bispora (strain CBS 962.96) TaxID=1314807 RepID=A0A4S8LVY1_DENBC|nr:hypothetical protein K435DRAFT_861215 [Dendrothele bispora CBS 962.96]